MTEAVDLIVSLALRKCQQFGFQLRQQGRFLGENHQTRLELRLVDIKSADLISPDWNEPHGSVEIEVCEILARAQSRWRHPQLIHSLGGASSPARSRLP